MAKSRAHGPANLPYALLSIAIVIAASAVVSRSGRLGPPLEQRSTYRTVVDEAGNCLFCTALPVMVGDQFIAASGRTYTVREVGRDGARAVGASVELWPDSDPRLVGPPLSRVPPGGDSAMPLGIVSRVVVVYHTHSDESYVPTDGRDSTPAGGGILAVGDALRRALEGVGYAVVHDRTLHGPHDALAYARSRRTAYSALSKYRPYLIFDVHRDSGPADAYLTTVEGKPVSQILIVVGSQNPLLAANLGVARRLKSAADSAYPGLVKGIFLAQSDYNQDLDPGALLFEVGTERMPRDLAQRAMAYLAQAVARAFGAPGI